MTAKKTVTVTVPTEEKTHKFFPLKDFYGEEFASQYLRHQRYWLRAGNDKLAKAIRKWKRAGLIIVLKADAPEDGIFDKIKE